MANKLFDSPMTPIAQPPAGYRGSSGQYDGEPGLPGRTPGYTGPPEKVRDEAGPEPQKPSD